MEDHVCKNKLKKRLFKLENDHEIVRKFLFSGARVFDFGCGDGTFFDRIKDVPNLKLVGFDIDKKALKIAEQKGYEVYDSLDKVKGPFDFVAANEVVEHLEVNTELPDFFKKAEELLSEDGQLIISTTNLNEFYSIVDFWNEPTHIRPFTIKSLERLGAKANFKLFKVIKHHMRVNPRKIIINLLLGLDLYAGYTLIFEKK